MLYRCLARGQLNLQFFEWRQRLDPNYWPFFEEIVGEVARTKVDRVFCVDAAAIPDQAEVHTAIITRKKKRPMKLEPKPPEIGA